MLTREDPLKTQPLITPQLRLIPTTAALVQAEIESQDLFSQALGAKVPENWPPELLVDVLPLFLEQLKQDPSLVGWLSWYWVLQREATEEGLLIGSGGFKGQPQTDGAVEIGYSILPQYQGRGYATEAVAGLLAWVFSCGEATRAIAETPPENRASIRVVAKLGFDCTGQGSEVGTVRFELTRDRYSIEEVAWWRQGKEPRSKLRNNKLPAASGGGITSITSHRRKPVSTNEPLDSGMRRNDDIRGKLQGIQPAEIST
jgi:RimJ/RimL family protein N-acetyltransferase